MIDEPAVLAAKKSLRDIGKRTRADAFRKYGPAAAERAAAFGLDFAGVAANAVVSGFAAIGEELDPVPLMLRLRRDGCSLALPAMQGKGRPLVFRQWAPGDAMAEKMWGIREPLPTAPEVQPDVVLAALLAFDRRGYRLGYGGGFYDRTLAATKARRPVVAIGIAFDEQEVEAVPHLDYDQRLDWVLTPSGPIRCLSS